jgi:hypothetical protein
VRKREDYNGGQIARQDNPPHDGHPLSILMAISTHSRGKPNALAQIDHASGPAIPLIPPIVHEGGVKLFSMHIRAGAL